MAEKDYLKILGEYVVPKLDEYSKVVENLLEKRIVAVMGSFNDEELQGQRQANLELYSKIKAGSLETFILLEGNIEKFEACLELALSRNRTIDSHGPYVNSHLTLLTSINADNFCGDIKGLAYLLEEKEGEDYLKLKAVGNQ